MRILCHVKNYFLMHHDGMPCVRRGDEIVRRSDSFSTTGLSENRFGFVEDLNERTIAKALIERWPPRLGPCDSGRTEVTIAFNVSFPRAATNRRSEIFCLQIPQ